MNLVLFSMVLTSLLVFATEPTALGRLYRRLTASSQGPPPPATEPAPRSATALAPGVNLGEGKPAVPRQAP